MPGQGPVDIRGLLPGALANPTLTTITCLTGCTNGNVLQPVQLVPQPGQLQLLDLARVGNHGPVNPFLPDLAVSVVCWSSSQFKDLRLSWV